MFNLEFGEKLKSFRVYRNIDIEDISTNTNLSIKDIKLMESGSLDVSLSSFVILAQYYGLVLEPKHLIPNKPMRSVQKTKQLVPYDQLLKIGAQL